MNFKTTLFFVILLISKIGVSQENSLDISSKTLAEYIELENQFTGGKINDPSFENIFDDINHISFIRKDNSVPDTDLIIRYVFTKNDSVVKQIRYEWDIDNDTRNMGIKKDKVFRNALVSFFFQLENQLISVIGESEVQGILTDETEINVKDEYYKTHKWIIGKTRIDLTIKMYNALNNEQKQSIYYIHMTYRDMQQPYSGEKNLIKRKLLNH